MTRPVKRKTVTPCECESTFFDLEYGEPVKCSRCGKVPKEISAEPLSEDWDFQLQVVCDDGVTKMQNLSIKEF